MRRIASAPRENWQQKVEEVGLVWHTGQQPYWNEAAFYEFSAKEVDVLEAATNELEAMTLQAAQHIIDNRLYSKMGIPESAVPLIESSWEAEPPSLYGRFDFAYDGTRPPKLLEYNADTPTSLLEAAVVQWYWLQDMFPHRDQFNSLHERLIALWKVLTPYLPGSRIDFCSMDDVEDGITVAYLQDTAQQAGLTASCFPIAEVGWDGRSFVGPDDRPLDAVFKLYPWEWMIREQFGKHIATASTIWMEPAWKMLLSNKGILPVLWKLFPRHPYLLESSFDSPGLLMSWVRKPLLGREGANITMHQPGQEVSTDGEYGEEGFIYQELAPLKPFDGQYPVIGSWLIGHEEGNVAAGMGIRESDTPITTNTSRFVPHLFG
ncbi:MAG TPA: glutathionylspermidine synthase family protein [Candidatus Sulfopaludibacter sp.]|jgi:glutathionylspermidine synthase|nr:glutathionylspermidine synthase family protein [Candidatus Sulfopaludibacter sp.]